MWWEAASGSIHIVCIVHIDSYSALLGTNLQQFLTDGHESSAITFHIFFLYLTVWTVFSKGTLRQCFREKKYSSRSCWPRAPGWTRRELLAYHLMTFVMTNVVFFGFWFLPQFLKSPFSSPPPYAGGSHGPGNAAPIALAWGAALQSTVVRKSCNKSSGKRIFFRPLILLAQCQRLFDFIIAISPVERCVRTIPISNTVLPTLYVWLISHRISATFCIALWCFRHRRRPCSNRQYVAFMEWGHDTRAVTLHSVSLQVREQCIYE